MRAYDLILKKKETEAAFQQMKLIF